MAGEPLTAAGKRLAETAKRQAWGNWEGIAQFDIPAIEAEAIAAAKQRIEGMMPTYPYTGASVRRRALLEVLAALAAPSDAPETP